MKPLRHLGSFTTYENLSSANSSFICISIIFVAGRDFHLLLFYLWAQTSQSDRFQEQVFLNSGGSKCLVLVPCLVLTHIGQAARWEPGRNGDTYTAILSLSPLDPHGAHRKPRGWAHTSDFRSPLCLRTAGTLLL